MHRYMCVLEVLLKILVLPLGLSEVHLTLYPLRRATVFPKSANKDTLPVYNMPFESQ